MNKRGLVIAGLLCLFLFSASQAQETPTPQTVLVFNGPINEATMSRLIITVQEKVRQGAKAITILINSNGGGVDAALAAYGYLRGLPVTITTHNFGVVDSAAVILYCAGTKRLASPDSRFVLHGLSLTFRDIPIDENQIGEQLRILQLQTNIMASIFAKTTGKTPQAIKDAITAKTALSSQQAKDWNLVTAIESKLYERGDDVNFVPLP